MSLFPTRVRVLELIESDAPDKLKATLRDNLTPAIALLLEKAADENLAVGQSKIGGAPDVPPDFVWPLWKEKPLGFVAQFDLAEVAPFDLNHELPTSGLLSFFYLIDDITWLAQDDKDTWRVFFWPREDLLERRLNSQMSQRNALPTHAIRFDIEWQYPECDSPQMDDTEISDEEFEQMNETMLDAFFALRPEVRQHHLLGYANSVQDDVMLSVALHQTNLKRKMLESNRTFAKRVLSEEAQDWRLLFQLDSHLALEPRRFEWMWGDAGMIYFCIRKDDLQQQNFQNVRLELQCG